MDCKDAWRKLEDLAKTLTAAQELYLDPLTNHLLPIIRNNESKTAAKAQQGRDQSQAVRTSSKFLRDLHALFVHALPAQRLCDTLSYVFYDAACVLFRLQPPTSLGTEKTTAHRIDLHRRLVHLLQALQRVGLGGEQAQRSFAHAMDKLMSQFIASEYVKVDWYGRSSVTGRLRQWVEDGFAPFVKEVSGCLMVEEGAGYELDAREVQQWEDMAVGRLGKARVADLFDYIVRWDRSLGAILDLKVPLWIVSDPRSSLTRCALGSKGTDKYRNTLPLQQPEAISPPASRSNCPDACSTPAQQPPTSSTSTSTSSVHSPSSTRKACF